MEHPTHRIEITTRLRRLITVFRHMEDRLIIGVDEVVISVDIGTAPD
ncbi:MAG: hypothetical protein ISP41_13725 [Alphaproteobacteria bacterium]|jgi:hypothetical protein|nr:hypothetical protein [Alphaproteobacteria bacterium]